MLQHLRSLCRYRIKLQLRRGDTISFLFGCRIGVEIIKGKYPRVFSLSMQLYNKMIDMCVWDWSNRVWSLQWRRNMFQLELESLINEINSYNPLQHRNDAILWNLEKDGNYTVKFFICKANTSIHQRALHVDAVKFIWQEKNWFYNLLVWDKLKTDHTTCSCKVPFPW